MGGNMLHTIQINWVKHILTPIYGWFSIFCVWGFISVSWLFQKNVSFCVYWNRKRKWGDFHDTVRWLGWPERNIRMDPLLQGVPQLLSLDGLSQRSKCGLELCDGGRQVFEPAPWARLFLQQPPAFNWRDQSWVCSSLVYIRNTIPVHGNSKWIIEMILAVYLQVWERWCSPG